MNLPCIVTDINGCNEIITNKINGLIIPIKNIQALFDAMKKTIDNEKLFQKMNDNARLLILFRYEQNVVWDALLKEYDKFL